MATIKTDSFSGGVGQQPGYGTPELADSFRDVADDLTELRSKLISLLAKLDADAGVMDTNYASTLTPAALTTIKG